MIKFFFNRFSPMVTLMEIIGVILLIFTLASMITQGASLLAWILYSIVAVEYLFLRYCTSRRWYKDSPRYSGVELHFRKAIIPTGYSFTLMLPLFLITRWSIFLAVIAFVFAIFAHINIILLTFHRRDRDKTPASFYTSGAFLKRPLEKQG
jgi:amino acid transporter